MDASATTGRGRVMVQGRKGTMLEQCPHIGKRRRDPVCGGGGAGQLVRVAVGKTVSYEEKQQECPRVRAGVQVFSREIFS